MLTIQVGSYTVQDPSWGGPVTLAVPSGPAGRTRSRIHRAAMEANRAPRDDLSVVSVDLFGLVEITQTRQRS